jgi:hypothetical protein
MAERMHSTEARASFMNAAQHNDQMAKRVEAISEEPDSLGGIGGTFGNASGAFCRHFLRFLCRACRSLRSGTLCSAAMSVLESRFRRATCRLIVRQVSLHWIACFNCSGRVNKSAL